MNDDKRGVIRNREFAQQIRDFSGLRYGKITPTDIDAFMDFGNQAFVFIEAKHGDAPLPYGQRLALERLCDATAKAGIKALVLIARHDTQDDIDFAALPVSQIRLNGKWRKTNTPQTVRSAIDGFLAWVKRTAVIKP